MIPLLLIIATVSAGSAAVAGEEERGTLELMLSLPRARRRLVVERLAALVAEAAGLGAVLWAALLVPHPTGARRSTSRGGAEGAGRGRPAAALGATARRIRRLTR